MLAAAWLVYCLVHSWLAALSTKHWITTRWPALSGKYRVLYNGLALMLLVPPLALTVLWRGPLLWQWSGVGAWLANGLAVGALLLFGWTLRYYDMREFLGLRQWRMSTSSIEDQERFHLSPLHRHVRHPWYFLGLLMLWTRDMDWTLLLAACVVTLYFIVGSHLEERKLMQYHGAIYRRYRERVPGLFPLPWKCLSRQEAASLLDTAGDPRLS
ncbi:MAG: hypothetical protein H6970_09270 [Gammaproteobacteria bacterium]|nr:hypothetical protein [Gammaproteobacteria bacterium]MCP5459603.1 hypothetical protein [Gammaproteobacteria bacterium]